MPDEVVTIRRMRLISSTAKTLVSPGDHVMPDTPVARTEALPGKLWKVDVSRDLNVDPSDTLERMTAGVGDKLRTGAIVAASGAFFDRRVARSPVTGTLALISKSRGLAYVREDVDIGSQEGSVEVPVAKMLGVQPMMIMVYKSAEANVGETAVKGQVLARFGRKTAASPLYGKIIGISPIKGTITIEPLFKMQITTAYLKGIVETVTQGESVEISGRARVLNGIWGLGGESCGRLHAVDGDLGEAADLPAGAIVAARGTATRAALQRAVQAGVKGVILGWLGTAAVMEFASLKNMGVTGDESAPFPLILMQGFLKQDMRDDAFRVLRSSHGALCSIRGVTHIRAGVVRPEILIFPE
ncbi:MAG: hypothetical protein ACM3WU_06235 [Bacillota bacterium]